MTGHHKPQPHLASGTHARSRRLYLAAQIGGRKNCTSLQSVTASYSNTIRKRLSYIRKGHRVFSSLFKANRVGKRLLAETLSTALSIPHLSFLTPSILPCPHLQPYKLSRKTPKDPPKFNATHFLQHARAAPTRKRYNPPTPPCTTEQPRAKLCNLRLFYQTLAGSGHSRGGNFKTQSRHGPQAPAIAPRLPPAAPEPRAEPCQAEPSQAARPRGKRPSGTPYPYRHGGHPPAPLGTTVTLQPTVKLSYKKPRGVSNPPPNLPALRSSSSSSSPLRLSLTTRCLQGAERRGHPRRLPGGGSVPPLLFALPSAAAPPPARQGSVWLSTAWLGWAQHGRDGGRGGARPERGAELEILKCTAAGRPWSSLLLLIINNKHF